MLGFGPLAAAPIAATPEHRLDPLERAEGGPGIDSAAWTGLRQTVIDARNAKRISRLIDRALEGLPAAEAGNVETMQAVAYLKAAKALVDAPEPPSEMIWALISKAADVAGLVGLFYTMFIQATC